MTSAYESAAENRPGASKALPFSSMPSLREESGRLRAEDESRPLLSRIGLMLRRWWEEPIGVAVPLAALLIVFLAPQMPDMFTGTTWGHGINLGVSAAVLGLFSWYWTRAALLAPLRVDDATRGKSRNGDSRDSDFMDTSREWAPRFALVVAALIASAPLLVAGLEDAHDIGEVPRFGVFLGIGLTVAAFWLVRKRHKWKLGGGWPAPDWMWRWRITGIFAAAPWGWPVALGLLMVSLVGASVLALAPNLVERTLYTPAAALAALGLVVGPLVLALSLLRDVVFLVIHAGIQIVERTFAAFGRKVTLAGQQGIAAWSAPFGTVLLIAWLVVPVLEPENLYGIRTAESLSEPRGTCARGADAEAPVGLAAPSAEPPGSPGQAGLRRPCIEEAVLAWHVARGNPTQPTPIIIVAAEGGASRAATWLLSAMRLLDRKSDGEFGRHLFAISGVSGGSLGAVTYLQALRAYPGPNGGLDWAKIENALDKFGRADLLAVSVATYFLNDTLARLLRRLWPGADRGVALERVFERHWRDAFAIDSEDAERGLIALHQAGTKGVNGTSAPLPHLFLNGTDAESGRRIITSTVRFNEADDLFAGSTDLLTTLKMDVPTATAVMNSARFPYISPAGRFKDGTRWRQVLDGGYFENYGARTAAELSARITQISDEREDLHLIPVVVVVSNDADAHRLPAAEGEPFPRQARVLDEVTVSCSMTRRDRRMGSSENTARVEEIGPADEEEKSVAAEYLAPLLGLYATRGAHGQDALHILRRTHCQPAGIRNTAAVRMFHIALPRPLPENGEAAPMNWVLNDRAACYLLQGAPALPFNQTQADLLARIFGTSQTQPLEGSKHCES